MGVKNVLIPNCDRVLVAEISYKAPFMVFSYQLSDYFGPAVQFLFER